MNKFLNHLGDYLINLNTKKLIFLLLAISFFKTGIWYHPALWNMLEIAKSPFENVFNEEVNKYYLYSSWLSPYMAHLLNLTTKLSFFLLHLVLAIFFVISFIFLIKKTVLKKNQKTSLIVFFVFPVSMTSFYWVGYDSLLLLLFTISIYFYKNLFINIICSIGIGLQHFEIGVVSLGLLFACKVLEKLFNEHEKNIKISYIFIFVYFIGLILGKIILYKIYADENLIDGRFDWIYNALLHLVYNFYFNFYNIIWFSLGIGWLLILKYFFEKKNKYPLIISLLLLIGIMPLVDDHTRVYSASSFMLLTYCIICNDNFLKTIEKKELSLIFLLWFIFPYSWVWQGDPRQSMFQYNIAYFINYFFDIFNSSVESSTIWPFERFK
tara:strand:+ start:1346 stop:2488 length:1143 start_codon:yes stop_codon:yes gene_type:complete